jgi:hypothetical protein
LKAEPSGAAAAGSMLCTGWHEPVLTSATSRRTWGATERTAASTPAQVAGTGVVVAGPIPSLLIRPRLSTVSAT